MKRKYDFRSYAKITCLGALLGCLVESVAAPTGRSPLTSTQPGDLLPPSVTQCTFPEPVPEAEVVRHSIYVNAEDDVKLALDVYSSTKSGRDTKLPTLFTATRYWRARDGEPLNEGQRRWIAAGYAVVNADVRGTGASFGQWYIPYAPQEARDIGFQANWIGRQPWSNGAVVMTGTSYPGTTPLLAMAYGSPAIVPLTVRIVQISSSTR